MVLGVRSNSDVLISNGRGWQVMGFGLYEGY